MKKVVLATVTSILITSAAHARVLGDVEKASKDEGQKIELRGLEDNAQGGIKDYFKKLVCPSGYELRENISEAQNGSLSAHCRKQAPQYYPLECPENYGLVISGSTYLCVQQVGNVLFTEFPTCSQEGFQPLLDANSKLGGQCFNPYTYRAPSLINVNVMQQYVEQK